MLSNNITNPRCRSEAAHAFGAGLRDRTRVGTAGGARHLVDGRAALGHRGGHRLDSLARPIDRERVVSNRLLHPGDERPGPCRDVLAGHDRGEFGPREHGTCVEGDDPGMCMRRAPHRGGGAAGPLAHVVGEAPAPGEQHRVLNSLYHTPDETEERFSENHAGLACDRRLRRRLERWEQDTARETVQSATDPRSRVLRTRAASSFSDLDRVVIFPIRPDVVIVYLP